MKREWKPGDVALWEGRDIEPQVVFHEGYNEGKSGARWFSATNGECWPDEYCDSLRPLVVIDPEAGADQRRLLDLLRKSGAFRGVVSQDIALDCIGDALREFANPTPPKPDEPTGLGAVVEDVKGRRWVRIAADDDPCDEHLRTQLSPPWRSRGMSAKWWARLAAVRVLSEGVTE